MVVSVLVANPAHSASPATQAELLAEGTRLGLMGDYAGAYAVAAELHKLDPTGASSQAFHLNTLLTQLSWDGRATQYDDAFRDTAASILEICEAQLKSDPDDAMAQYYCGQANFSLAFLNALRGRQYKAGVNGTRAIRYFEKALALDPDLVEPRMHLGMAYFYADNLPPYIKLFSRLLWFIPSGHSEKSLPFVRSVMESDSYLRDVARFVFADLARNGDEAVVSEAITVLEDLVLRYPQNPRLQLALAALLVNQAEFAQAAGVVALAIEGQQFPPDDEAILQLWRIRALLGMGEAEQAMHVWDELPAVSDEFPTWAGVWLVVTEAQLLDLKLQRADAIERYRAALDFDSAGGRAIEAAKRGLQEPFSVP